MRSIMITKSQKLDLLFWTSDRLNRNFQIAYNEYNRTKSTVSFDRMLVCKKALDINARSISKLIQNMASAS